MKIPMPLSTDYSAATSREIRSWSFGVLKLPRQSSATRDDNVAGTLHDQRIFGPIRDFECACRKYVGADHMNMICERCGVKVASKSIRATRFAHIEFLAPIAHPFAHSQVLQCFPVLPINFIEAPAGKQLPDLYDQLINAAKNEMIASIDDAISSIIAELLPIAVAAHDWRLPVAETFANGLALKHREQPWENGFTHL